MKRLLVSITLTGTVLFLSSCANPAVSGQNNHPVPSTTPAAMHTGEPAFSSPSSPESIPLDETGSSLFSTLSPDGAKRIECVPCIGDADSLKLKLVDTENEKTLITYDYPSDTEFTALWNEDSSYCAIGYKNKEESRTILYSTRIGSPTTGKEIVSKELSSLTDSIHPQDPDAHIMPKEFTGKTALLLSVDWINASGDRSFGTTTWDFEHGTFTEITE